MTAINYLPFGPASGYAFGNGQTLAKTFDHAYRSTGVVSTPLYLQYTLDAAGNPVALTDAPGQTSPVECVFRSMPATDSGACRPGIPVHAGHPFRSMPAGASEAG